MPSRSATERTVYPATAETGAEPAGIVPFCPAVAHTGDAAGPARVGRARPAPRSDRSAPCTTTLAMNQLCIV
ncbi:hypothetical protein NN3_54330 [Nocardia neocaledoniensis NBRC 108232]|nr:hypothetical protein NN3_54330 [Nocardia neocaledoniensis NBRC 108232]